MKATKALTIRMTDREYKYAIELSKRTKNCPRPVCGSVAHGLKYSLRKQAESDGLTL